MVVAALCKWLSALLPFASTSTVTVNVRPHVSPTSAIPYCSHNELSKIKGYLLDLDGTMYSPAGLLEGVPEFFDWLHDTRTDHVLLSNGFKTSEGVASKFASPKFKINQKVDPKNVHTAGVALANYMKHHAPAGSRVYGIGTGITYGDGTKDSLLRIFNRLIPERFATWDFRTDMTMNEILEWADLARKGENVFVVLAPMANPVDTHADDPVTGRAGYTQMDYELMKKINTLLRNNAYFIVGSPDVADSQPRNPKYSDVDTAWPTTGGMESLFLSSAEMFPGTPKEAKFHANVGKGGNQGVKYMMKPGIDRLTELNPKIQISDIAIIGDNFGTDIKAGNDAGVKTILVLVGAHQLRDAVNWTSRPTCYVNNVGDIPKLFGYTQSKVESDHASDDGASTAAESPSSQTSSDDA